MFHTHYLKSKNKSEKFLKGFVILIILTKLWKTDKIRSIVFLLKSEQKYLTHHQRQVCESSW